MAKNKEDKQQVYTPEHIDKLRQNEIFVFGSNLNGWHDLNRLLWNRL